MLILTSRSLSHYDMLCTNSYHHQIVVVVAVVVVVVAITLLYLCLSIFVPITANRLMILTINLTLHLVIQ